DGRLGVRAMGGRAINVTMNVSTPDVEGFRRSRAQVAAQLGRAIGAGSRNR
ncbi:MAG: phage tail tape measure protein, partial [Pseudomonadota bacterium]